MVTFLTSSFVEYMDYSDSDISPIIDENGFVSNLLSVWKPDSSFLFVASDPDDYENTRKVKARLINALLVSGFSIGESVILDRSTMGLAAELVKGADVIYLSGGHAPTQNRFFKEIGLKELLKDFDGVVVGLSAGSVNAAENVYLIPELPGEAVDPDFSREGEGLGLTDINIVPHSNYFRTKILDGLSFFDDILLKDSVGRKLYFIQDGSYFIIKDGEWKFFGEGDVIENKTVRHISTCIDSDIFSAVMRDGYELVFEITNREEGKISFKHISDRFRSLGISEELSDYRTLIDMITDRFVIENEKEQIRLETQKDFVTKEIEHDGEFARAFHFEMPEGIHTENLRMRRNFLNGRRTFCIIYESTAMANRDWMTDVFSREGFIARMKEILPKLDISTGCSIVYANIKNFKTVNEVLGEQSGDMVIFQLRDRLKRYLEPIVLSRFESDHFIMLVDNSFLSEENLKELCSDTYEERFKKFSFTIRLGIYRLMEDDRTQSPIHMADRAKLAEKLMREDSVRLWNYYDEEIRVNYLRQGLLISDLKDSIKNDEFKAYYQPIVDARSRKIISAEALVRWDHHTLGMVSPGEFIPAFENSGKISQVDDYMIEKVTNFQNARRKVGKKTVPVSVNLSRIDFYDYLLLDHLSEIAENNEDIASIIRLEVTESAYAALESGAMDFLRHMRRLEIPILLDDYGSGMSSLSTLESFDFDIVKLDMGFVRKIGKSQKAESIIRSTIDLSHGIGARVVAEGVETAEQHAFLYYSGCDMIQGYYFYKPLPQDAFAELLSGEG
ncbi:MAG: EAL domain-containing protein [Lachnospiraceae bacterium]|nr:EAL domain-containing protein [Lachnospiraceae bacterium]